MQVGNWEIGRLIGAGGAGTVRLGTCVETGQIAAVKFLNDDDTVDSPTGWRFHQERNILAAVDHPGILRLLDSDITADPAWFAIEYCNEGSMADAVLASRLGLYEVSALALEVLDALEYLHGKGYIHRDIKPENILLDDTLSARLCDFGIAQVPYSEATQYGDLMGSPSFMPPEQMDCPAYVSAQSDLYSLGATMFAAITRTTPLRLLLDGRREAALQDVPAPLRDIVDCATRPDPDDRFFSAKAMSHALADSMELL